MTAENLFAITPQHPLGIVGLPPIEGIALDGYIGFRMKGDSMSPTVKPGDCVVVDPNDLEPGEGLHVIWDGLGACVKRLQHGDGCYRLTLDNHVYSATEVSPEELVLLGKVVGFIRTDD